jgi:hypothetical protein
MPPKGQLEVARIEGSYLGWILHISGVHAGGAKKVWQKSQPGFNRIGVVSGRAGTLVPGIRTVVVLAVAVLLLSGCVGTIERTEFEAELQARGGGLDQQLVIDAVDDVGDTVGTDDYEITTLSATPTSGVVTMTVRDPSNPENLDDYTWRQGTLDEPRAVQVRATDDIDSQAFSIQDVALDEINDMVDTALAEYDTEGGFVNNLSISPSFESEVAEPQVLLSLESPRSTASATFDADGNLLSLEKS